MAYDLEEQEQLAELKAWWHKYGNLLLSIVTALLLAYAGWTGWRWYEREQSSKAAAVYLQLEQAVRARDVAKVQTLAGSLTEHYGRSIYAPMGALQAARLAADAADFGRASEQLRWVIDKSGHDELALLARVRLAGVLLDSKQLDQALLALNIDVPAAQATLVLDRRGDVLQAQGKLEEARAAYAEALAKADAQHPLRPIIQLKLDSLPAAAS